MVTINPAVLEREGYTGIAYDSGEGEIVLHADDGGYELFAVRDSFAGWSIPTDCGKVLEFCRSVDIADYADESAEDDLNDCPEGWDCVEGDDEGDIADEIDDDDWTTDDGCIFRHRFTGRIVLDATDMTDAQAERAAGRIMRAEGFFPNIWYISDHGNVSVFTF